MKKKIIYVFILVLAVIIQKSILTVISEMNVSGDAVAMAVLALSIVDGFNAFLPWAVFAGVLYDMSSHSLIGTHVFIFLMTVYLVSFFSGRLFVEHKLVGKVLYLMFIVTSTVFTRLVLGIERSYIAMSFDGFWKTFGNLEFIAFQILWNIALFYIIFISIKKIKKFFDIS